MRPPRRWPALGAAAGLSILLLIGCPSAESLYGRAYAHFLGREEDKALTLLKEIIDRDPRYAPAYLLKGTIYDLRGNWTEAEKVLLAAKRATPPSAYVCFNLGNIYFKTDAQQKAVAEYGEALALKPDFNEARINRANAFMMLKDYDRALADYEKFLELTGEDYPNVRELVRLLRQDLKAGVK